MLSLSGLLTNAYIGNPYINKDTGDRVERFKIQLLCDVPQQSGGIKKELVSLSVKKLAFFDFEKLVGKYISVPVGVISNNGVINFWMISGSKPDIKEENTGSLVKSPLG